MNAWDTVGSLFTFALFGLAVGRVWRLARRLLPARGKHQR